MCEFISDYEDSEILKRRKLTEEEEKLGLEKVEEQPLVAK